MHLPFLFYTVVLLLLENIELLRLLSSFFCIQKCLAKLTCHFAYVNSDDYNHLLLIPLLYCVRFLQQ